jgi:hypothetical protein
MDNGPLSIIFVGLGALFFAIALVLFLRNLRFASRAQSALGTVIDQDESHDEGVSYSAIVTFTTDDGAEITFTDSVSTYPAMFEIGDEVKVLYLPEKPGRARIATTSRLHLLSLIFSFIGAIFIAVGVWVR